MKKVPIKKVRRIEVDADSGVDVVTVFLEVPKFKNFGQRLGELERKAWDAEWDHPPRDKGQFEYNLQRIRVVLPEGMTWDKAAESTVDRFLLDWPGIRPAVLKSVFKLYKKIQPTERSIHDNPGAPFLLPEPTSPEVVANLFHIFVIHLHEDDDTIGIAGGCTWDLEHLWGVLLRKNKVVEVGGMDVAF